jgi:hypothetical protein
MAICGNGVVEEGEECDCGWEEDCLEDCCWPQRTKFLPNQVLNKAAVMGQVTSKFINYSSSLTTVVKIFN